MILQIENVHKSYQNHVALKNINLEIEKGSIFGLLGPNGAGKTSLIRILTSITESDSGTILFNGIPLSSNDIYKMGYLPEERGLYKKMTVKDQLLYFAELKGLSNSIAKQKLKYWIDKFEIRNWLDKKVEELSKGMQQKVQFIATVLHEPELIILDEPFSGFDPINAQLLVDEILQLKQNGSTIIFSTHRMDSVELLCDNFALINQSELVLKGDLKSIKQQFKKNQFQITYTGETLQSDEFLKVESDTNSDGINNSIISLVQTKTNNELLMHLLNKGISIHTFGEKLPSMEEIFIMAVQQKHIQHA
ncbi:MAG: ATP-binding cassette domain-containing protein [Bacteroidia bacterium]|nr:ATP-binding cassette domain-containing protein [Bacteroidia bacterium]MCF8446256.1 ATP-binding cassette domain-containing protein [Bacteroidia bacterium]